MQDSFSLESTLIQAFIWNVSFDLYNCCSLCALWKRTTLRAHTPLKWISVHFQCDQNESGIPHINCSVTQVRLTVYLIRSGLRFSLCARGWLKYLRLPQHEVINHIQYVTPRLIYDSSLVGVWSTGECRGPSHLKIALFSAPRSY